MYNFEFNSTTPWVLIKYFILLVSYRSVKKLLKKASLFFFIFPYEMTNVTKWQDQLLFCHSINLNNEQGNDKLAFLLFWQGKNYEKSVAREE